MVLGSFMSDASGESAIWVPDPPSTTPTQQPAAAQAPDLSSKMDNAISALKDLLGKAYLNVGITITDDAVKASINTALDREAKRIDDLDTRLRNQVMAGQFSIDKWTNIANLSKDAIISISGYADDASYVKNAIDTVKTTAGQVATTVEQVAKSPWTYVAILLAVVGIAYIMRR